MTQWLFTQWLLFEKKKGSKEAVRNSVAVLLFHSALNVSGFVVVQYIKKPWTLQS